MESLGESGITDYSFSERERFGQKGEKMVADNFATFLKPLITKYLFGKCKEHTAAQLNGIDMSIKYNRFEIKTRDFKYHKNKDIVLETMSNMEKNKLGWFYTSNADIVIYMWLSEDRKYVYDAYLLIMDELRKYEYELVSEWYVTKRGISSTEGKYKTEWYAPPISAFPKSTLIHIDIDELNRLSECGINEEA